SSPPADRAPAFGAPPARRGRRRLGLGGHRRRLFVFAAATAAAAVVAAVLVLGSGPTAQPAAAAILRQTAKVAASPGPYEVSALPGPGQFLYRKFKRIELKGWVPGGTSSGGGMLPWPNAFNALMPTTQQWWTGTDGAGRVREVAGTPRFFTTAERTRWEEAGARLPAPFDPEYQRKYHKAFAGALALREGVVDTEHGPLRGFHFPDTSKLPTSPEALRHAVEANAIEVKGFNLMWPGKKHLDAKETSEELLNVLTEGIASTPQLRAAIFNALAELPGIEIHTGATDFLGREGDAIRTFDNKYGTGSELIFDPDTSAVLAQRYYLTRPSQERPLKGLPGGTTIMETDYLRVAVVDSTHATGAATAKGSGS
ncbi:MAG: CU044_5270 family protein, partial [Actinobacteria bacterium]|nr:CU044_5270 family protein [Actinomycetota bacterium]